MVGVVSGAASGMGCAIASCTTNTALGGDPSVVATITFPSVGGTSSGYTTPAVVDATGAADSSAYTDVGSGITSIAG